ncbi:hypothetical protein BGZ51_005295 [Haplosporangium sp. Z 767]|nr:hypothetical protein BGZ51_005295 [Haplosporangium sp. Z 767]KAF9187636.1 hypothetical protein BGZ50_001829 [Haplosporangium sp. Z 11]
MAHHRSKSGSSMNMFDTSPDSPPLTSRPLPVAQATPPLSTSLPRTRSMSTSFGLATSPIPFSGANNPFLNPTVSSTSSTSFATTPPTNLSGVSNNVPSPLNRRFSSSFTNPLSNHHSAMNPPPNSAGLQSESRGRRHSFFVSSSSASRLPTTSGPMSETTNSRNEGGGGIGGLFRKFSTSGRSGGGGDGGGATQYPDGNEAGPPPHPLGIGPLSNFSESNSGHPLAPAPTLARHNTVNVLKPVPQDKDSRSSSPMRSMILNGQMLD